jgi:PD-(D/E)XK nuclease superfamily
MKIDLPEEFPVVVDSSMRVDYSTCPKKFYYRHVLGLTGHSVSIHLNAGGAYAKALETFRKKYYSGECDFETAQAHGVLALLKAYGDVDYDPGEAKQWYRMVDAFLSYFSQWHPEFDYLKPAIFNDKPAVEFSFAMPLEINHPQTQDPLLFTGRFDMFGEMNGCLFVVDDKTTSRLGAQWSLQWDLRSQFTGYCWAAKEYDYPVVGAVIRGSAILKNQITHAEAVVYRPDFIIKRWEHRMKADVAEMVDSFQRNDFPNKGEENGGCCAYSGCAYQKLCLSDNPQRWVENEFIVHRWNPMHKEE